VLPTLAYPPHVELISSIQFFSITTLLLMLTVHHVNVQRKELQTPGLSWMLEFAHCPACLRCSGCHRRVVTTMKIEVRYERWRGSAGAHMPWVFAGVLFSFACY